MAVWHPDAMVVIPQRYPRGAGPFAAGYPPRQVVHTTEGPPDYYPNTLHYYGHQGWPHATIGRVDGIARIVQHIPIDRAARTLESGQQGVQTNYGYAVQTEVCWRAADILELPDDLAACLGSWLLFVADETQCPLVGPAFVGPDAGFVLASKTAPQRMWPRDWAEFTGVCGHQHVPFQTHWDPGGLHLDRALILAVDSEDDDMTPHQARQLSEVWDALHLTGGIIPDHVWHRRQRFVLPGREHLGEVDNVPGVVLYTLLEDEHAGTAQVLAQGQEMKGALRDSLADVLASDRVVVDGMSHDEFADKVFDRLVERLTDS